MVSRMDRGQGRIGRNSIGYYCRTGRMPFAPTGYLDALAWGTAEPGECLSSLQGIWMFWLGVLPNRANAFRPYRVFGYSGRGEWHSPSGSQQD
jgi:hypothetical protein